jgi:hypothetical protein
MSEGGGGGRGSLDPLVDRLLDERREELVVPGGGGGGESRNGIVDSLLEERTLGERFLCVGRDFGSGRLR